MTMTLNEKIVCDNLTDDDNATKLKQELRAISANKN